MCTAHCTEFQILKRGKEDETEEVTAKLRYNHPEPGKGIAAHGRQVKNPRLRGTLPLPFLNSSIPIIIPPDHSTHTASTRQNQHRYRHNAIHTSLVRALQQLQRPANHIRMINPACNLIICLTLPPRFAFVCLLASTRATSAFGTLGRRGRIDARRGKGRSHDLSS